MRKLKQARISLGLLLLAMLALGAVLLPLGYADNGIWRLISPTEFTTAPAAAVDGIYTLNGGTGSIGSGNAWAVGDDGFIFHWDGFSWRVFGPSPSRCELSSVSFGGPLIPSGSNFAGVSNTPGWIVGGAIGAGFAAPCALAPGLGSTALYYDGTGWSTQTNGLTGAASADPLRSVYTVTGSSSVEAWAVGGTGAAGHFWHWFGAPGGGGAWSEVSAGVASTSVNGVYMTHCCTLGSADEGWAVGNAAGGGLGGRVYHWFGGNWNLFQTVNLSGCGATTHLFGIAMDSTTDGWAVGSCGSLYHFSSGTWNGPVSAGTTTNDLFSIVLLNSNEGWAVGAADGTGPTILHGTNLQGTPNWNRIAVNKLPTASDFLSVTYGVSGNNIWAVGKGGLMALCSSGCSDSSTWATTTSPLFSAAGNANLKSVFMTGDNDGWAVGLGASAGLFSPQIFHWDGFTWTRGIAAASNKDLWGVFMTGSSEGWAVGGPAGGPEATVHFTGGTWTDVTPPGCACILKGIYMASSSNGWAVGTGGKIEHLTSSSGPWGIQANTGAPGIDLFSVYFDPADSTSGWAVGGDGVAKPVIIHTINGGLDGWPTAISGPGGTAAGVRLFSIFMRDNNHIWVVGDSSTILFSGNNGGTWTAQLIAGVVNPPLRLFSVYLDSNNDGWAGGIDNSNFPVLVHYDGTGWTQIPFTTLVPNTGSPGIESIFLTSSTNGLAVGDNAGAGTLALVFHLDPPGVYGGSSTASSSTVATSSTVTTPSTTSTTTSSTESMSSTSATSTSATSTSATSTSALSTSTTAVTSSSMTSSIPTVSSTSVAIFTVSNTPTTTTQGATTSSVSTPLVMPPIPGFPWESIIAGIAVGMAALAILRRRRK